MSQQRKPRLPWKDADLDTGEPILDAYTGGLRLTVFPPDLDDEDYGGCSWEIRSMTASEDGHGVIVHGYDDTAIEAQLAAEAEALTILKEAVAELEDAS